MKPSPLAVIALVFAASFSGRAVSFAYAASRSLEKSPEAAPAAPAAPAIMLARSDAPPPAETTPASEQVGPGSQENAVVADPGADRDALLAAIRERAAALDAREAALQDRERVLEAIERRVAEKTAELKAAKAELESRLSFAETAAQSDISLLAKMYESMKPQKAGEIFNAMEPSFAAGFLTQMNSESAALILANMETEKAYAASVIIAGRNATVNKR
jgi:flagellar motility protein MotE (MotC chaperone)